jgi:hypothetical protein
LHALLLSEKARELAPIYRKGAIADADMQTLLQAVLQRHDAELTAFIENAPQTNEVRRAAGLSRRRIGSKPIVDVISSPQNWGPVPVSICFLISSTSL